MTTKQYRKLIQKDVDVAALLGLSVEALLELIRQGKIPAIECGHGVRGERRYLLNPLVTESHLARLASVTFDSPKSDKSDAATPQPAEVCR